MSRRTKKSNRKSRAQSGGAALSSISEADIIDLNDVLMGKTNLNTVLSDLEKLLQSDLECGEDNFQLSIMGLFFNLCGIASSNVKLNVKQLSDDIAKVFENIYQQPKLIKNSSELPLAGPNNIAHKKMYARLLEFWEMLLSDKTNILVESKMLAYIFQGLALFCNNKIRTIRSIATEIANTLVSAIIESNITQGTGQRAKVAKKFIYDVYHKILKERLQDVDTHIRERLVYCLTNIIGSMSNEFLTVAQLQDVYVDMLSDKSTDTQQIALESLRRLYSRQIEHKTPLIAFGKSLIKKLSEAAIKTRKNTLQYVQLLNAMLSFSSDIKIENACQLYCQIILTSNGKLTVQEAGSIFFKSLFPQYRVKSKPEALSSLKDREFISTIVRIEDTLDPQRREAMYLSAINFHKEWFDIDEMFLMMITETIIVDAAQRRMSHEQLRNSLILLMAYMRFISLYQEKEAEKTSSYKQNILNIYNKRLLVYCKQIFFEKVEKHPSLLLNYVKLFTQLHRPLPASFDGYLTVITNQLTVRFENTTSTEVMDEIVSFFKRINPQKVGMLLDTIDFTKAIQSGDFIIMQKCSSLVKQFKLQQLVNLECLTELTNSFERQTEQASMLAILQILNNSHLWLFRQVFVNPSEDSLKVYITSRDMLMKFLEVFMNSKDTNDTVRLTMFTMVCDILRLVTSNKYQDTPIIMYEPQEELVLGLLRMLVYSSHSDQYDDISKALQEIMTKRNLNQKLATSILKVCESSIKFSMTDCIADFLTIVLLKCNSSMSQPVFREMVQSEAMNENSTRFMFWRVFRTMVMRCDDTKRSAVIDILLGNYFNRATAKKHTQTLLNKLILFLAELIDQAFGEHNPTIFVILQMLLKKTVRRYGKQTLSKINAIFLAKYNHEEEEFRKSAPVKAVKDILSKKTRVATSTAKKRPEQSESDREQASDGYSRSQSSRSSASNRSKIQEEQTNDRENPVSGNKSGRKMSVESSGSRSKSNRKNKSQPKRRAK